MSGVADGAFVRIKPVGIVGDIPNHQYPQGDIHRYQNDLKRGPRAHCKHWESAIASLRIPERGLGVTQGQRLPNMTLPVASSTRASKKEREGRGITPKITYCKLQQ